MLCLCFNGVTTIDIERRKNRLFKFCYVPATSAAHNRLLSFFFAAAVYSTNEANKAGLKQSIFLDVYCHDTQHYDTQHNDTQHKELICDTQQK